jgi:hypothetical protein
MSRKNAIQPLINRSTNRIERRTAKIAMRAGREAAIAQGMIRGVMQAFTSLSFWGRIKLVLLGVPK